MYSLELSYLYLQNNLGGVLTEMDLKVYDNLEDVAFSLEQGLLI